MSVTASTPESPESSGAPASVRDFFDAYWNALEDRGWAAVILHSWQDLPDVIESDVDYAVKGPSQRELLEFLAEYSRSKGWRLVQVIEHEPGAFFCVCMQPQAPFDCLQLDVTWEYRRIGHHLVRAEILFDGRRKIPGKCFEVPSPGVEFTYLIAKAAAKGKDFTLVQQRLSELLAEEPEGCLWAAEQAFGSVPSTSGEIPEQMAAWFEDAPFFRKVRSGRKFALREFFLYLRRILQPTGIRIPVLVSETSQEIAELKAVLAPAFRQVIVSKHGGIWDWLRLIPRIIRTTLVIQPVNGKTEASQNGGACAHVLISRALNQLTSRVEKRIRSY